MPAKKVTGKAHIFQSKLSLMQIQHSTIDIHGIIFHDIIFHKPAVSCLDHGKLIRRIYKSFHKISTTLRMSCTVEFLWVNTSELNRELMK